MENLKQEKKWKELESINDISERIRIVYRDTKLKRSKFKKITEDNPIRMFELLGGKITDVYRTSNWAPEFSYEDYIEEQELEYDDQEAKNWDLEKESIKRAIDLGFYFVTGFCEIKGQDKEELYFEFDYLEGYVDSIIGTPYNTNHQGNVHGIEFS